MREDKEWNEFVEKLDRRIELINNPDVYSKPRNLDELEALRSFQIAVHKIIKGVSNGLVRDGK